MNGRRGGGRSRAYHTAGGFQPMKSLLYGEGGGSSHSWVLETALYQAPPEAILLRKQTFPAAKPFVIRNRVLGRLDPKAGEGHRIAADSSLINYAYRSSHYLLGGTLQNPAIEYTGISRQNRACGLLFENPASPAISQIHPVAEHTGGGRSQHSLWSVHHENVLLVQRIACVGKGFPGSYHTGKLGIRFDGADLTISEQGGWIFASLGKAFATVKFLDGGHVWDAEKSLANPAGPTSEKDTTRILLHAGDITSHQSFENFRTAVLAHPLKVTADQVDYRLGKNHLVATRYDARKPSEFKLPFINGQSIDLDQDMVYQSPFLNGKAGGDQFTVTVGPLRRMFDFSRSAPPASKPPTNP